MTGGAAIEKPDREERRKGGIRIDPSGYDAGKKVTGKKRHILVDTLGLLLHAIVHPADIQDRDGGVLLLSTLFGMYPFLAKLFADAGYQGPQFAAAVATHLPHLAIEIVKRSDQAKGFVVLPMIIYHQMQFMTCAALARRYALDERRRVLDVGRGAD